MRKIFNRQFKLGEIAIGNIKIDIKSRDDIPQLLLGLQYIYTNKEINEKIFNILSDKINSTVSHENGRPGMDLWKILVMGVLRLNLNCDYDRLQELVNNHKTIRQMLGHGMFNEKEEYKLQTLKDNVGSLTPELLDEINQIVVHTGHNLLKKNEKDKSDKLRGRVDSFVVETNVHYPTDINLLFDASCKVITLLAALCLTLRFPGWENSKQLLCQIKQLFNKVRKLKSSTSEDADKKALKEKQIKEAHQCYIEAVAHCIEKVRKSLAQIHGGGLPVLKEVAEIRMYVDFAVKLIDQIERRVLKGEQIPHSEKIFSIFQEHTEWISKGKAGVPVELGLKVCVLEDQYGFILHHQVMQEQTDDQVAVTMVREGKKRFSALVACSFDKGFHSPDNQKDLRELLDLVVLPKKGKLSASEKQREYAEEFIQARHQHSAVESGINALEVHGLDRCPDNGLLGFSRYVALAIVGRNIQKLGAIIRQKERDRLKGQSQLKRAA